jgi:hypothetical protein
VPLHKGRPASIVCVREIDTVRRPLVLIASGSVNDSAAYLAVGAVAICAAMLW